MNNPGYRPRRPSYFFRSLRGRSKSLGIVFIMVLLAFVSWLREVTGIRSVRELNEAAEAVGEGIVLVLIFCALGAVGWFTVGYLRGWAKAPVADEFGRKRKIPRRVLTYLEYWRQSLVDGSRASLSLREIEELGSALPFESVLSGTVRENLAEHVHARTKETNRRPDTNRFGGTGGADVLIAPLSFRRVFRQGLDPGDFPRLLYPFWMPASLTRGGELVPPERALPWIPRNHLEPVTGESGVVLGSADAIDEFIEKHPYRVGQSWKEYVAYCDKLFRVVTGSSLREFSLEGYERMASGSILPDNTVYVSGAERRFNEILEGRSEAGLCAVLTLKDPPKSRARSDEKGARLHSGQFESRYALMPSHRRAVHQALQLEPGEVLAITGPPGTGKTTLIQSLVASLWTNAARRGASPPLIVCCSATNQATLNVIQSFAKTSSERWLPRFKSFGTFCSSETKSREVTDIPYTLVDGSGTLGDYESEEYGKEASAKFLERFSSEFTPVRTIDKAIRLLRKELAAEYSKVYGAAFRKRSSADLFSTLAAFDTGGRYRAFRLATRYWEGRWLLALPKFLPRLSFSMERGRLRLEKEGWQIRAMLTPCFVSTFSMAPQFFGGRTAFGGAPIDLLIVDEASQVTPEVGAATVSLAKKAVVIGDPHQLEPVWSVQRRSDYGNLERFGIVAKADYESVLPLEQSGVLASSGSLMNAALHVSSVRGGMFLREHFRSVPKIVEFANTLCYHGRLEPLRPEKTDRLYPSFGYAHVRGFAQASGKSRMNREEAQSLSQWLLGEKLRIEEAYQTALDDVVAIVTPFVAQSRALKELLHPVFPRMTIGTVGALQGAERPIVIFSPVYDRSTTGYLFDQKPNMLNVAVTRARDSFVVIGDMGIFRLRESSPSAVLARYLFADPANEIGNLEPVPIEHATAGDVTYLSTLDEHREALIAAFRSAKREVFIVSPTISIFAIEHDKLDQEIAEAVKRGVEVNIFTDEDLDRDRETESVREPAERGRTLLVQAGARLTISERIHNKVIATDERDVIIGSFNWLSAVRKRGAKNQKYEISAKYSGATARKLLAEVRNEVERRGIVSV